VSDMFCDCNEEVLDTTRRCIVDYDGIALEEQDRDNWYETMDSLRTNAITKVAKSATNAYCTNDCNFNFDKMLVKFGWMMDNSLQNKGEECDNFRHMSNIVLDFVKDVSGYNFSQPFDEDKFVNWLLQEAIAIPTGFWCGREKCSGALKERFLGCCAQNMVRDVAQDKTVTRMLTFFKSLTQAFGEDFPVLTKKTQRMLAMYGNPMALCKEQYERDECVCSAESLKYWS